MRSHLWSNSSFFTVHRTKNLILKLPSFVIHLIMIAIDQLRNRNDFIAFCMKSFDDTRQGIFCIFGTVVHEDDGTVPKMFTVQNTGDNGIGSVILPVETVIIIYKSKGEFSIYCIIPSVILIMEGVIKMYKSETMKLPSSEMSLDDLLAYHEEQIEQEKKERRERRKRKKDDSYRNEQER